MKVQELNLKSLFTFFQLFKIGHAAIISALSVLFLLPNADTGRAISEETSNSRKHWAFSPIKNPLPPQFQQDHWAQTNIDRFILRKIKDEKLSPSEEAPRNTLIRRIYFDLLGHPPKYNETQSFIKDPDPNAYAKLVDNLLSSPEFGEKWARHWLDIARYADTKGYVFQESREYPYAYSYRDWVINSLNQDLPYNEFIIYQLAADTIIKNNKNKKDLAAMGFLTVGRRFLNRNPDIIDDRMDVTFRGLMGLTVACSRCHDHKYDPIPISDYYSIYGVFDSSVEPSELPLLGPPNDLEAYNSFKSIIDSKQSEIDSYLEKRSKELIKKNYVGKYLLTASEGLNLSTDQLKKLASSKSLLHEPTIRWRDHLKAKKKSEDPIYAAWFKLFSLKEDSFTESLQISLKDLEKNEREPNKTILSLLKEKSPKSIKETAQIYASLLSDTKATSEFHKELDHVIIPSSKIFPLLETRGQQHVRNLRKNLAKIKTTHHGAPAKAMVLVDRPAPREPRIFQRGDPNNKGKKVPRQFLGLLENRERTPYTDGSGRIQMARSIASDTNPLTSRVWVNRVWGHLMGSHLVSTPSDFGLRSDHPSHPELLDYLAFNFIKGGWSTKKLIRSILLSSTYKQSSLDSKEGEAQQIDPENRLFTKANRKRLNFESFRDSILYVSEKIDTTMYGRPVDITSSNYSTRRSIYARIERQNLPPVFRTFDFASPDVHSPKRPETTVPQQALFVLNNKLIQDQSTAVANSKRFIQLTEDSDKITLLYQQILSRDPSNEELQDSADFIVSTQKQTKGTDTNYPVWDQLAQALLSTNEFIFID
ncbi:MAG: DUF1549 and DUF1553 domain-containing protein [Verrucomicrobiales bacterium]|nr:MAG: DUF1553 domain-containing protein [Verrucomicrobiaceae bacterium]